MKKISSLLESVKLGKLEITNDNFTVYKKVVSETLLRLYKDHITIGGAYFVARQSFENPERVKSILNYTNTNIMLATWIVNNFDIKTFDDLIDFIISKAVDLFLIEGEYFTEVIKILKKTEEIGIRNELASCKIMADVIFEKLGKRVDVMRTETDSADDIFYGVDIFFDLDGKQYTCQVKPLKEVYTKGDKVIVRSSGRIKKYSTHYWMFIDNDIRSSQINWALFQNKEPKIMDVILEFDKLNLVSTSIPQVMI
jgi:hypothetical protein